MWLRRYLLILITIKTCWSFEVNPLHLANSVRDSVALQKSMFDDEASHIDEYSGTATSLSTAETTSAPELTDSSVDVSTPSDYADTTTSMTTPETTSEPVPTDPSVTVRTSSDSVTVTWYRAGPWSDVDDFNITITDLNINIIDVNLDIYAYSDDIIEFCSADVNCTDTLCSFDSRTECPEANFTSCSKVSVIVTGGESSQPEIIAEIAPEGPSEILVELNGTVVDLSWTLPSTCETGSRLSVNVSGDEVNEVLSVPANTYSYTYSRDLNCSVGQAIVSIIGKDGESDDILVEFLLTTEIQALKAIRKSDSSIQVTWENLPYCVEKMNISWYNQSDPQTHIGTADTIKTPYTIIKVGSNETILVCVFPKAKSEVVNSLAEGEKQCITASEVDVSTSSDSVMVTLYRKGLWSDVGDFNISITDINLDINDHSDKLTELCSADVNCNDKHCTFDSRTECTEAVFASCSNVNVTVTGGESSQPTVVEIAPQSPSEISVVERIGAVADLSWTLPSTCETGSRIRVNVSDDEKSMVLPVPKNTYKYTYSGELNCGVGQAIVTAIGKDGESKGGTSIEFLMTEIKTLRAIRNSDSTILVTWHRPSWLTNMNITWYSESEEPENFIATEGLHPQASYTINDVGSYKDVLVCVTPKAKCEGKKLLSMGEKQCITAIETVGPPASLEITASSSSEIYIYWTPPLDSQGIYLQYIVSWSNNETGQHCGSQIKNSDFYAANILGLDRDTLYDIYVAAANEVAYSSHSAYIQGRTTASSVTVRPSLLITAFVAALITCFSSCINTIA